MTLQTGAQRKETWDMGCPSRCRNELAGALRHEETEQIVGQHIAVFKKKEEAAASLWGPSQRLSLSYGLF